MASQPISFFIVGAGSVGVGLTACLTRAGHQLVGVWNRGSARRRAANEILGVEVRGGSLESAIEPAELILACVRDDALDEIALSLSHAAPAVRNAVVAHTSGCVPSTALAPVPAKGHGGLHPLVALPDPLSASLLLQSAPYALEGDTEAVHLLEHVSTSIGGRPFRVLTDKKASYHAAAVMASNLIVALLDEATQQAREAGVEEAAALMGELSRGALERALERGTKAGLTGPVVRGDTSTIARHCAALGKDRRAIYASLSRAAVHIARERGMDKERLDEISRLLD